MARHNMRGLALVTSRLDELFANLPKRLDVQEVADLLGMHTKGVYRWLQTGVIPAYKVGSTWLILRDELKDTLAQGSNLTHRFDEEEPTEEASAAPPVDEPADPEGS